MLTYNSNSEIADDYMVTEATLVKMHKKLCALVVTLDFEIIDDHNK